MTRQQEALFVTEFMYFSFRTFMKVTEGTWLDSNGNPFGIGHGSGYVQKHGRYQNWLRPTEPLADGLTYYDYVHLSHTRQGKWITYYHPESKGPLVCQKPLESKFLIYATTIFFSNYILFFRHEQYDLFKRESYWPSWMPMELCRNHTSRMSGMIFSD